MAVAVSLDRCTPAVAEVLSRLPQWWERQAAAAGLPEEWRHWEYALGAPPVVLQESLSRLLDESAYEIGEAYIAALEPSMRLHHGRHYTPRLLAEALWQEVLAVSAGEGALIDPAAGAGALLIPPLRRFVEAADDPVDALSQVSARFGGTDLDPIAVWLGNALLAAELLPLWCQLPPDRREPLPRLLRVADGLFPAGSEPQTIVMNPPYGRVRLSAAAREQWKTTLYGHANRYSLFLQAAVERVSPGGVVAAVIPTSFLGGSYFQRLRTFLAREAPLARLTFIDTRAGVFVGGVLQETCLAIFRKGGGSREVTCSRLTMNGKSGRVALPPAYVPAAREDRPWLLPRAPRDRGLIRQAARFESRLSDYGWKACTGPLVWNRHKPQIDGEHKQDAVPIVWAADFDGGTIRRAKARDPQRWILLRPQDRFMRLTKPALLVQRTTAPEQPRRLVVATLDTATLAEWGGAVVVENHVNVLQCSSPDAPLSPALLHRLLDTPTVDRLYRCVTGSVAVSAYELEALPMPPADVLLRWEHLDAERLARTVSGFYGDEPA